MKKYIIAGHSFMRPGAVAYDGNVEHDFTSCLQKEIVDQAENYTCLEGSCMKLRTDGEYMSNQGVITMINSTSKPGDFGIDLHFNNNNPKATGVEIVVHPGTSAANKARATYLVNAVSECLGLRVRKRENNRDFIYPSETFVGSLGIIERTNIPMMLLEVCFLNEHDLKHYMPKRHEVARIIKETMFLKTF